MYLYARLHMCDRDWEEQEIQDLCKKIRVLIPEMYKSGNLDSINISFEVGYWRKSNQIHNWFVKNVQNKKDDCGNYYVSRDDLKDLVKLCRKVKKSSILIDGKITNGYTYKDGKEIPIIEDGKLIEDSTIAKELLPVTQGCFFGSTQYNEWYIDDIKDTIKIINKALKLPEKWNFEYTSSW